MKAIINVKKQSVFAKFNKQAFEIDFTKAITCGGKLILPIKGVNPEFPNNYVDFSTDELLFSN